MQADQKDAIISQLMEQMKSMHEDAVRREEMLLEMINKSKGKEPQKLDGSSSDYQDVSSQIEKFIFAPEECCTFERWIKRVNGVFASDKGKRISEMDKAAIIRSKLSNDDYNQFANDVIPKSPEELSLEEHVKHLTKLFGRKESLFSRRYKAWQIKKRADEDFLSFGARIKKVTEDFEFSSFKSEDFMMQLFVQGLDASEDAFIRKKMLEKTDDHHAKLEAAADKDTVPELTLDSLTATAQRLVELNKDCKSIELPARGVEVAAVAKIEKEKTDRPPKCRNCRGFHLHKNCPFKDKACFGCQQLGHTKEYCKNRDKKKVNVEETSDTKKSFRKYVKPRINGVKVALKHDSGSDWTIISKENWKRIGSPRLIPPESTAISASGGEVKTLGYFSALLELNGTAAVVDVQVSAEGLNLFGNVTMEALDLWNVPIAAICSSVSEIHGSVAKEVSEKFPSLFSDRLGLCTRTRFSLKFKEEAKAPFIRARQVPMGVRKQVEEELCRLESQSIISRINYAEAAAPIVAVKKKNGSIRIAADYSTGLNKALEFYHYPLPTPESIFATLAGMNLFTTLDLSNAFLQVELDDKAKRVMAINTHIGLFQVNRMQPGVKTAPGQFQQLMDTILAGTGATAYLDDIIVPGKGLTDHRKRLEEVLKRLEDAGLTLQINKCKFAQTEIKFLGKIIDANGQRPDPEKLQSIKDLPRPTDVSQLRAFLGAINWFGNFLPHLKDLRGPLDEMLRKGEKFVWTSSHEEVFNKLKQALHSNLALVHYDPTKPLVVAADASSYGIGATLMHREKDGQLKPIAYASTSFNDAEKNYPQVEREALALVYAVKKFHIYIYGRKFELHTDHKPLLKIFGSKTGMPVHTANRLRRYALTLLGYDFEIKYIDNANFAYADFVSRLINSHAKPGAEDIIIAAIRDKDAEEEEGVENEEVDAIVDTIDYDPISLETLAKATLECDHLQKVIEYIKTSWPEKRKCITNPEVADYFAHRGELQVVRECLFHGNRPVIPPRLRKQMLDELHEGHPGASRMQALARTKCFWPEMNKQINAYVQRCESCATNAKAPRKEVLHAWPRPDRPWQRIHVDFAGPMDNDYFFIIVDAYSNWPEIFKMRCTTAEKTITVLKDVFSRWGPCETIVSDNGPQFTASIFKEFCKSQGIEHITSAPYHPQSNGRAERFVDIFKTGLRKLEGKGTIDERLVIFLQNYRKMPSYTLDNKSPFELMTNRVMPSRWDRIAAAAGKLNNESRHMQNMTKQFNDHHGARSRAFKEGDSVYYQLHQGNSWSWKPGVVLKQIGATNYEIQLEDRIIKAHTNMLKTRYLDTVGQDDSSYLPTIPEIPNNNNNLNDSYISQEQSWVDEDDPTRTPENQTDDSFESCFEETLTDNNVIQQPDSPVSSRPQRSTAGKPPSYLKDYIVNVIDNYIASVVAEHLTNPE